MILISEILTGSIVCLVAVICFAAIFHCPKNQIIFSGIVGMAGWAVYLLAIHNGSNAIISSFFATLALAVMSRVFANIRKAPVTIFLIPGIFPLVPGAGIYETGYILFMGSSVEAFNLGLETLQIAVAIALGMGITLSMPQILFNPTMWKKRFNEKDNNN